LSCTDVDYVDMYNLVFVVFASADRTLS